MARKKTESEENEGGFSKMLATTVILGIVFSAGLITGQRLLRAEARAPMVALSTTKVAAASGDGEQKPSLRTTFSFYEHLTGKAEATSPPPTSPVEPAVGEVAPEAATDEVKPEVAPEAEPKPEAVSEPEAAPAPKPEPQPEPEPEAAPAAAEQAKPESDSEVAAMLDEVVASLSDAPPLDKPAAVLPARYTLQVSSHPDRESAERELARLNRMGVEPHVVKVNVPGKGELWRVRVGKFHTMDEARDFQGNVKSKRGVAGFVTPL